MPIIHLMQPHKEMMAKLRKGQLYLFEIHAVAVGHFAGVHHAMPFVLIAPVAADALIVAVVVIEIVVLFSAHSATPGAPHTLHSVASDRTEERQ
jgi:hypothetical protein